MYEYRVIIDRWVDGDTVDVDIDLGFRCLVERSTSQVVWRKCARESHQRLGRKEIRTGSKGFLQEFL